MILEALLIATGLMGFAWAGWKDLKTTEFPDWVPYSLIAFALAARGAFALLWGNYSIITSSVLVGSGFLGLGLVLYWSRQWGDGDAWLLGAMGFLYADGMGFQQGSIPFPLSMLFNFFLVSFLYIVGYSLVFGLKERERASMFWGDYKKGLRRIAGITVVFTAALFGFFYWAGILGGQVLLWLFPALLFLLLSFVRYGRFIEDSLFKRKISVKYLREGDVPVSERWRVLGKGEIKKLRKRGGSIWVKEGVRFAPVFLLTVAAMLAFGNLWELLTGLIL